MHLREGPKALQLNQKNAFDKKIGDILANDDTVIHNRNWMLLRHGKAGLAEFVGQRIFIDFFQKARTERV